MSFGRSMEAPMDFDYTNERPLKRPFNNINEASSSRIPFNDKDRRSNLVGSNTPFLFHTTEVKPIENDKNNLDSFKWDVKSSLGLGEVEMADASPKKDNPDSRLKLNSNAVNKMRKKRIRNQQKSLDQSNDNNINYDDLPILLTNYAQTGFNLFLLLGLSSLVYKLVKTILKDVEDKVEYYIQTMNSEASACARSYALNQCDPKTRVPVSEEACIQFEQCMHRDPTTVGIARVGAAAFAEILEGFANEIGLRGGLLIITLLTFFWLIKSVNSRSRYQQQQQSQLIIDQEEMEEFQNFLKSNKTKTNRTSKKRWGDGNKWLKV